jgi:DNA-binding response OmpR family regulator
MNRILLVEDDETLGYLLREYLQMNSFDVVWTRDGQQAWQSFSESCFDLALVDVMLPAIDGITLLGKIKSADPDFPAILLTAKSLKIDKLKGFHSGADDYIVKPVDEEELVARIKAVLRRSAKPLATTHGIFTIGRYCFQYDTRCLKFEKEEKVLSCREADLLKELCLHREKLVESSTLLKNLWGKNDYFNKKSMDVFMHKLRVYLRHDPEIKIVTVHNKGYILKAGV